MTPPLPLPKAAWDLTCCVFLGCRTQIALYILFDTRMDIPEALQSPMDPNAHEGWR